MSEKKNTLWVVIQSVAEDSSKAALPSIGRKVISKSVEITNSVLAENIEAFFDSFEEVLSRLPAEIEGFSVDEVELTLAINASGGVELVGKAEAGVSTGLNLTLKRKQP